MRTSRMKVSVVFAAMLALVAVLALGPGERRRERRRHPVITPSSTGAASPRPTSWHRHPVQSIRGRPPAAACSAAWCTVRCTTPSPPIEGGLKPFATGVTAPPGASADAAVAQAARDVLVARVPGQTTAVEAAYAAYMASIPNGPAKDAGKAVGTAAAAGMLAMRTGDHFDDVVPYVQPPVGPGVFEPIAPTPPVDTKLPLVRPFTYTRSRSTVLAARSS